MSPAGFGMVEGFLGNGWSEAMFVACEAFFFALVAAGILEWPLMFKWRPESESTGLPHHRDMGLDRTRFMSLAAGVADFECLRLTFST